MYLKTKIFNLCLMCRLAEKARKERERERREQYKQVRVHVKKDDGRMQAYGWSLPAKFQPSTSGGKDGAASRSPHVPVPVPVYCRPLLDKHPDLKVCTSHTVDANIYRLIIVIFQASSKVDKSIRQLLTCSLHDLI